MWEAADGSVNYVDGGIVFEDGTISKRFVAFEHEVTFDGDRKRPLRADIVVHRRGRAALRGRGELRTPRSQRVLRDGELETSAERQGYSYYTWNSTIADDLLEIEANTISMDQLMRFDMDGMTGHGIFELLVQGRGYPRYPTWALPQQRR